MARWVSKACGKHCFQQHRSHLAAIAKPAVTSRLPIAEHRSHAGPRYKSGGNLLLSREAPYPLGHTSTYHLNGLQPWPSRLCGSAFDFPWAFSSSCPPLQTTPVGFEPTRGDPIGLAGRRLNHSAKVSSGSGSGFSIDRSLGLASRLPVFAAVASAHHSRFQCFGHSGRSRMPSSWLGRLCVFDSTSFCVVSHVCDKECRGMPTLDLECLVLPVTCNA